MALIIKRRSVQSFIGCTNNLTRRHEGALSKGKLAAWYTPTTLESLVQLTRGFGSNSSCSLGTLVGWAPAPQ